MLLVPLQPIPDQLVTVTLNNQVCSINVYQLSTGMFLDLYVANVLLVGGVICQNINRIVRNDYIGFIGDLIFVDTAGSTDPVYTGLGSRYQLAYLDTADLNGANS